MPSPTAAPSTICVSESILVLSFKSVELALRITLVIQKSSLATKDSRLPHRTFRNVYDRSPPLVRRPRVIYCITVRRLSLWLRPLLNIGAGYAAKHACSCHFLQGRDLDEIRVHDLNFSVLGYTSLTAAEDEVRSSFFGLVPRRAVYREGVGCTLINDERKPLAKVNTGAAAGAKYGRAGKDSVALRGELNAALEFGMQPVPGGGARGIVVMHNGAIVGERYAEGYDATSLLLGWSMTKTLIGMALGGYKPPAPGGTHQQVNEQLLHRKELYPAWSGDARSNIKLTNLLRMNSGLAWNEAYGAISDAHDHASRTAPICPPTPPACPPPSHRAKSGAIPVARLTF